MSDIFDPSVNIRRGLAFMVFVGGVCVCLIFGMLALLNTDSHQKAALYLEQARLHESQGDWDKAQQAYGYVLRYAPYDAQHWQFWHELSVRRKIMAGHSQNSHGAL